MELQLATKTDLAELRGEIRADLLEVQRTFGTWLFASQAAVIAALGVAAGVVVALT
jgi:hypothetical protein